MARVIPSPDRPRTAVQYVKAVLRAAIVGGEIPHGARLVQQHVAQDLGVSTTPVRQALLDLANEGLVEFNRGHAAFSAIAVPHQEQGRAHCDGGDRQGRTSPVS